MLLFVFQMLDQEKKGIQWTFETKKSFLLEYMKFATVKRRKRGSIYIGTKYDLKTSSLADHVSYVLWE